MSTPHQPHQGRPGQWATGQAAQQRQPAQRQVTPAPPAAPQQPVAHQAAPPARQAQAARPAQASPSSWTTPRLLRLARAGAAAAVLLTGVAATGTFSADGLNATPDVIAQQWVAAERAGVEIAQAELRAAERVSEGDPAAARESFDAAVVQVGTDLSSSGLARSEAGEASREWSTFVLAAERAAAASARSEGEAAAAEYAAAAEAARAATERTDVAAAQHAQDLRTGSRSVLTGVVGTLSTLVLVGIMVWLALRTRRIVNVPLLLATAITAGLTYLSINPAALPLTYDQRLEETTTTATALQQVYQARAGQHAAALGQADRPEEVSRAGETIQALDVPGVNQAWQTVQAAHDEAFADGDVGAEQAADLVRSTQEAFEAAESGLRERLEQRLGEAGTTVGLPAGITSGAAILLGLVGAVLAWTGLTRRLQEYR